MYFIHNIVERCIPLFNELLVTRRGESLKILTIPRAKEEIRRLQDFINLVENYEANSLEKWIIKEYAYTSSIREVVVRGNKRGFTSNGMELDLDFVKNVIAGSPKDELHRLLRLNYRQKIKLSRPR
jgi:hypothetical protein